MIATLHVPRPETPDEKILAAVNDAKVRLVRLRDALVDLHEAETVETRACAVSFRGGAKTISAVLGR